MYLWNESPPPSHKLKNHNTPDHRQSPCSTSTSSVSITKTRTTTTTTMSKHRINPSYELPLFNSINAENKLRSILPFLGMINMTISCGISIYRSYQNGDTSTVVFLVFIYFATFLLYYLLGQYFRLSPYEKSKKSRLKIGIGALLGAITLGFGFKFSSFLGPGASLSFLGIVIGGNVLLFFVCFVWDDEKRCDVGSSFSERKCRKFHASFYRRGKFCMKKYRHVTVVVDADGV